MTRKRKTARPADPMAIARRRAEERAAARDPATWGIDAAALRLEVNRAVEARPGAGRAVARAARTDVFDRLLARGALTTAAHNAVRRLQDDIALLHRTATGGGDFSPRVDRSRSPGDFDDARRRAGERIEAALSRSGVASARLLGALCEAECVLGRGDWREIVSQTSGERLPDAQSAILRAACDNLAGAYAQIDRGR